MHISDRSTADDLQANPHRRNVLLLIAITVVYHALHYAWYGSTVFGRLPVLDSAELLQLAKDIRTGTLPHEPFYRAPFYSILLAPITGLGLSTEALLVIVRWINTCFHLVSVALLYVLSLRIWSHRKMAFFTALLYALYPVALHFTGDVFDISLAITFMLAGLWFALRSEQSPTGSTPAVLGAGFMWALGAITRPHLLVLVLLWPLWQLLGSDKRRMQGLLAALVGPVLVLSGMGLLNAKISGRFEVMPLQGAFDLYAANRPGAHGKYMIQTREFKDEDPDINPARLESEVLYKEATGHTGPLDYREVNTYWRSLALKNMFSDPLRTAKHMLRKTYYLLNQYEQYNNKTYALHKQRAPLLRYNILMWPLVLALGLGGFILGRKTKELRLVAAVALIYGLGVLMFYVSARFRLPLVPLLALFLGGWTQTSSHSKRLVALSASITVLIISMTSFAKVADQRTYTDDYIMMSRGAIGLAMDKEAEAYALEALDRQPTRRAAHKLLALARYNLMLSTLPTIPDADYLQTELQRCEELKTYDPSMTFSAGVYHWLLGEQDKAVPLWRSLTTTDSPYLESSLAALVATGRANESEVGMVNAIPNASKSMFLLIAEAISGNTDATAELSRRLPATALAQQTSAMQALFQPRQARDNAGGL